MHQIETINRLLNAQPGRNRGKAANPNIPSNSSTNLSPSKDDSEPTPPPPPTFFRTVQSIKSGEFSITLSAPEDPDYLRKLDRGVAGGVGPEPDVNSRPKNSNGLCSVDGCDRKRIYRCVKGSGGFDSGGCGLEHFKLLEGQASRMDEA